MPKMAKSKSKPSAAPPAAAGPAAPAPAPAADPSAPASAPATDLSIIPPAIPGEKKRKPRESHAPYQRKPKVAVAPSDQTSDTLQTGKHLSYGEWLVVIDWYHKNGVSQSKCAEHFRANAAKGWKVSQNQLSRQLARESELRALVLATPTGMSAKRPRVVTNPQVERALVLWFQGMEARGELVTGPMLLAKRGRFEAAFDVPEKERLSGSGWIDSFKKTYQIKEHRRHGEAGSVDPAACDTERVRLQELIAQYAPEDCYNGDEGALNPYTPPDRGLATKMISGKKASKFRITLFFVCNATGSDKEKLMFIGKSKKPRCFKNKTAEVQQFYYRNNAKAWMNAYLFEEWVKQFDLRMRRAERKVLLLLDNFAGHSIAYKATNVRIEFLAPNMTSRIQPLDAGVIRAFKAHYRRALCLRALDADDAGEPDIWKTNLLEAMHMARRAWDEITPTTIRNCWQHTGILPPSWSQPAPGPLPPSTSAPTASELLAPAPVAASNVTPDPIAAAWSVVFDFAADEHATLPKAEDALKEVLGKRASEPLWVKALSLANCESGEESAARIALENLRTESQGIATGTAPRGQAAACAPVVQLQRAESALMEEVRKLKARNRIWDVPTLDELVDPVDERQVGEGPHEFVTDEQIVAAVRDEEAAKAEEASGRAQDADSDDEGDTGPSTGLTTDELMRACDQIMDVVIQRGMGNILDVQRELLKVKGELRRAQQKNAKQLTLTSFFGGAGRAEGGAAPAQPMEID